MSKPEITKSGVEIQEFNEVFTDIATGIRNIYGDDINLDQDSPDGQRLGIISKLSHDLQIFGKYIYNSLDPDLASGQALNTIIKFNGLSRRPATRSQKDFRIITNKALILPNDFELKDDLDQLWLISESKYLNPGENSITFYAKEFGAVESQSTAEFTPQLIIDGIISITSSETAMVGQEEETDEELRIRRNKTFDNAAYSTTGGLLAKLLNLPNVVDAVVYENDSDIYDDDKNMPPRSIWCVIDGGEINSITECIVKNKTGGVKTLGEISNNYHERIARKNGSFLTIVHTIRLSRSVTIDLHVKLTIKRRIKDNSIDIQQIKSSLSKRVFNIDDAINASELYGDVYVVNGAFSAYDLEISCDGKVYTNASLMAGYGKRFAIRPENINISEII